MKITAVKNYKDAFENKEISKGETYDTSDDRARHIVELGFAIYAEQKASKIKEAVTEQAKEDTDKVEKKSKKKKV